MTPASFDNEISNLQNIKATLKIALGREPTDEEIKDAISRMEHFDAAKVRDAIEDWNDELGVTK